MTTHEERRYKAHLGTCIPGLMPSVPDQETRKSDNFPLDALTQHAETLLKKKARSYFSKKVGECMDTEVLLRHVCNRYLGTKHSVIVIYLYRSVER